MRRYILFITIVTASFAEEPMGNDEVIASCKDVDGTLHKLGDAYIGPDACNRCKCLESGNACTKRLCPHDSSSRSAEANLCVDNMGVLHDVNQSYTHVDGCNTCKCGQYGGACTRKFCLKKEARILSSCLAADGTEKALDEEWRDQDGCNNCVCGILGAVCTELSCGEHRVYENEKDQVKVHELIHTKEGTIVDESGDQPCTDQNNKTQWPGSSWLSPDSCNVCTCMGNGSLPVCTKMGCRVRLERLLQTNLSGGAAVQSHTVFRLSLVFTAIFAAFL